jgi:hypothetical protein
MSAPSGSIWYGSPSVLTNQSFNYGADKSGNSAYTLHFQNLSDAQTQIRISQAAGWRAAMDYEENQYTVTLDIGYNNQLAGAGDEPDSVWTVSPNYIEKPILESGIPLVKSISVATKEKILAALKNPGKAIPPSDITTELSPAIQLYNLMRAGTESIPYATVTVTRKIKVPKFYISNWTFANVNSLNVMSKSTLVSSYSVPFWVESVIPNSFTEDLGNGYSGFWGYREVREPYQEAPKNMISIGQSFIYDRWLTAIYTPV